MKEQDRLNPELLEDEELQNRYLTFWIDRQLFGMPIAQVVQIVGLQEITELPDQPDYAKGVISLRGQIIPVMDVRLRFGKKEAPYTDRTCIIITRIFGGDFGLIVDEVDEVTDILPEKISLPPNIHKEKVNTYLTGIARLGTGDDEKNKVALLVHPGRVLNEKALESLPEPVQE
ncbi:chemotaxis protein CheW [Faecalispora anaeroviscerum]|uniref:chemotaxis protein CheW n=1 Tax=Faecalispora anaeroviscerum TaxID=2991836 RepID=UPI0024BBB05E|nr:chemotaxis protein CheW [Faecalispora anaeroviscerum]